MFEIRIKVRATFYENEQKLNIPNNLYKFNRNLQALL